MKILMTADAVGGVWTYAVELTEQLCRRGARVALATMGTPPAARQVEQFNRIKGAELHVSEYRLEWMDDPWADVDKAGEWLLHLESKFQPDIVHLNGYAHGALAWSAPTLVVAHSCVLSWWLAVKVEPAPEEDWQIYRQRVREGIESADYVVAPSRAMLNSVRELYGRSEDMMVIRNGRSPEMLQPRTPKRKIVVAAGRLWDEAKNIKLLDSIANELDWPVLLAGSECGPLAAASHADVSSSRKLGQLDPAAFANLLSEAAIFCLPARYEPFGLSVLEAALSGCALVLGDIPSLRENWDGAAVFVAPNNPSELAHVLKRLIDDSKMREALAQAARQRAQTFTVERMADGYWQIYSKLCQKLRRSESIEARQCA